MDKNKIKKTLKEFLNESNFKKLSFLANPFLEEFVTKYVELCKPKSVFISSGSQEDLDYIRKKAIENGEEAFLKIEGHTIHFDAYGDQGRDRENTKILLDTNKGDWLDHFFVTGERNEHLEEIHNLLKDIMNGREMFVCFFTLGPCGSEFQIPCVQITDSAYVAHSENILYRQGYNEFTKVFRKEEFFKFVHSQGEVDERHVSKNLSKRRIFIDLEGETVFSVNTQYGGNTIGLKKLAMRLAIAKASREGWLTEHMLIMGVRGPENRITYFTGAFPSMCGKTSTAMLEGETIVGDDIAYLRVIDGVVRGVNVEKGMFGIIQGVNSVDDPIQWKTLHSKGEIIFSNVLVLEDGSVYWIGHDGRVPEKGLNHSGEWFRGKRDAKGKEIPPSHPNARFTVSLEMFENVDKNLDNPNGVQIHAIVYGGRDSDTWVPVCQSFDWEHGIILKGASIESETTAATLGKEGVREFNPMSNLDFLSIPLGKYIQINLDFGLKARQKPLIFGVNYFLKDKNGNFFNEKNDKKVWLKWMELRVWGEAGARKTPCGYIPLYEDLKKLFKDVLNKDYSHSDYTGQFTIRIPENLSKIERLKKIYSSLKDIPQRVFILYDEEIKRLKDARECFGDYIPPDKFEVIK